MELARFYGEEPQRLSAAAAAVAAAAGEGWGGLMQASPFSTLAAILVTFKQTLKDIQQHPKRYAVLLATSSSSSSSSKEGSSKKTGSDSGEKDAAASVAASDKDGGGSTAAADGTDASKRTAATAAAETARPASVESELQSQLMRKCSVPNPTPAAASAAAAGSPKTENSQHISALSPHQERLQLRELLH